MLQNALASIPAASAQPSVATGNSVLHPPMPPHYDGIPDSVYHQLQGVDTLLWKELSYVSLPAFLHFYLHHLPSLCQLNFLLQDFLDFLCVTSILLMSSVKNLAKMFLRQRLHP